jgi:hypothetical protein
MVSYSFLFSNDLAGGVSGGLLPLVGVVRAQKTPQDSKACDVTTDAEFDL